MVSSTTITAKVQRIAGINFLIMQDGLGVLLNVLFFLLIVFVTSFKARFYGLFGGYKMWVWKCTCILFIYLYTLYTGNLNNTPFLNTSLTITSLLALIYKIVANLLTDLIGYLHFYSWRSVFRYDLFFTNQSNHFFTTFLVPFAQRYINELKWIENNWSDWLGRLGRAFVKLLTHAQLLGCHKKSHNFFEKKLSVSIKRTSYMCAKTTIYPA